MKRLLGLALVALFALGSFALPQSRSSAQIADFTFEAPVEVHETETSFSKKQVFQGETFYIRASASVTVKQDISWRNVASAEFEVVARHRESGQSLTLSREWISVGPFIGLRAGTAFRYQLLNIALQFPPKAILGEYSISAELVRINPEWIWEQVKDRVTDVSLELGSIKYLGVSKPEIRLTVSIPNTINAGEAFSVELGIDAPAVEQVQLSLYTQETGKDWSLAKGEITSPGVASATEEVTAPIYSGELKVIAEATGFTIAGTELSLPTPVIASATTLVELPRPTMELAVTNPVEPGKRVPFTITVDNPSPIIEKIELQIQPSWVKTARNLTVPLQEGTNVFQETVEPLPATGEHSLSVRSSRYLAGGSWTSLSPALEASALVTTGVTPVASLTLQPGTVYPGARLGVQVEVVNPTADEVTVPYKVFRGSVGDSSEQALELRGRSLWKDGSLTIPAAQKKVDTLDYVFTDIEALVAGGIRYQGFELVVDEYSVQGASIELVPPVRASRFLSIRPVMPPLVKLTPSASLVDAGQALALNVELRNPMDVSLNFAVEVWERVALAGEQPSLIERTLVSLGGGSLTRLQTKVTAPNRPVEVEYLAQVSEVELAGVGSISAAASSQATVRVKSLVLPAISLALNPNPVQAGSSVEAKVIASNPAPDQGMTIPVNLYLKLPGKSEEPWGREQLDADPGKSASIVKHLAVPEKWQDLGTAKIIAEITEFQLGGRHIVLATPLRVSREFSIINLRLRALLQTTVVPALLSLSYDSQNRFLVAESVGLDSSIVVSNAAGWENSPDIKLRVEVTQSRGVELIEGWKTVEVQTRELHGKTLILRTKVSIQGPIAERLKGAGFELKVTAAGGIEQSFSLGIPRMEGVDWYLDRSARLINKATGEAFFGSIAGVTLPQEYLDEVASQKAEQAAELLAGIDSLIIDMHVFRDQVNGGATIMPSAQKAWERLQSAGSSLRAELALLRERDIITEAQYGRLTELDQALQELQELKTVVDDKYGDSPTPRQVSVQRFTETVGGQTSRQLSGDPDGDGLATLVELQLGYDPYKWDSQQEGMSDGDYFTASLAPEEEELTEEERDLLSAYASLYLLDSTGAAMEDDPEGTETYEDLSSSTREDLQGRLRDNTWDFCRQLLGFF